MKNQKKYFLIFGAIGVISFLVLAFLLYSQNQIAAQNTPSGNDLNTISKTVNSNSSGQEIRNTVATAANSNPGTVTYTPKFECGSIYAGEGPLRPGHYDTDISIFNKQKYKTTILWNIFVNNGSSSNAILVKLNPETATAITCQDIRRNMDDYNDNFLEGFIVISVPLDSTLQSSNGNVIPTISGSDFNFLEVQVFYTANALDVLPHEVIVDKISFNITKDGTGKIPQNMLQKTLDMSIPSGLNKIDDTENKVKNVLAKQYNLSNDDLSKINIEIKDVSVGVGVLIDDHAISLSTVKPQLSS